MVIFNSYVKLPEGINDPFIETGKQYLKLWGYNRTIEQRLTMNLVNTHRNVYNTILGYMKYAPIWDPFHGYIK